MLEDRPVFDRLLGPLSSDVVRWLGTTAGTAKRDANLLLQAGYPRPFNTLGDFYGWKVITAFLFFLSAPGAVIGLLPTGLHLLAHAGSLSALLPALWVAGVGSSTPTTFYHRFETLVAV